MAGANIPWSPTDEERRRVRLYAGLGLNQEQIGTLLGKSVDSLARHCREDLDKGKAETIAKIAGSLAQKALAGDTASIFFYLKTQAGWRETERREHSFDGPLNINITERIVRPGE